MAVSISGSGPVSGMYLPPVGQCRLSYNSGSGAIDLKRFSGSYITIAGVPQQIPAAGLSLAATGLTPNTFYYLYVFMNGAAMAMEASATARGEDPNTGVPIKGTDQTRTLVGAAYCVAGPAWPSSARQALIINWWNRQNTLARSVLLADATTAPSEAVFYEFTNLRTEYLSWAGTEVDCDLRFNITFGTAGGANTLCGIAIDSATLANATVQNLEPVTVGVVHAYHTTHKVVHASDGYHYATLTQRSAGVAATYQAPNDGSGREARMLVTVEG